MARICAKGRFAMSEFFAFDDTGWDHDTGKPGISLFGNAIQVWAVQNAIGGKPVTILDAAAAFKCDEAMIIEAVENHYWMFVTEENGVLVIEHEGE